MKKLSKKLAAGFLAFAMVLTTALPYLPVGRCICSKQDNGTYRVRC